MGEQPRPSVEHSLKHVVAAFDRSRPSNQLKLSKGGIWWFVVASCNNAGGQHATIDESDRFMVGTAANC
jgi:hypothetical protein